MYGAICGHDFLLGVFDLQHECATRGIALGQQIIVNESDVRRGRNRIMHDFLHSDATHMIAIDADIGFKGRDVLRLVAHAQAHPNAIVGATYRKKTLEKHDFAVLPLSYPTPLGPTELLEVTALPGGFMCISRPIAERLAGAHHADWYHDPNIAGQRVIDLFAPSIDPTTRDYYSEDYAYCLRWRDLGGRILLDPNIGLTHHGMLALEGRPRDMLTHPPAAEPAPMPAPRLVPDPVVAHVAARIQGGSIPGYSGPVVLDALGRRAECIA